MEVSFLKYMVARSSPVSFANTFNPHYRFGFSWPKWDPSGKKALIIQDGLFPLEIGADGFREVSLPSHDLSLDTISDF